MSPALQLVIMSRFVDLPHQASSVTCLDALLDRNMCHLQHVDAWIVVVIVMVMMMMMMMIIILIITVTIMIINCAVSSVT